MNHPTVSVRVEGEMALWTRPETKFERVSYPLPTPSGARGVLEAIYWHPQFLWRIRRIAVLKRGETFSILRNEVNSKMVPSAGVLYPSEDRAQRHAVMLKNVAYNIEAEVVPKDGGPPAEKHRDIFRRRVERGQCHHRPVLGTRECAAEFEPLREGERPVPWDEDLGLMLWDLDFGARKGIAPPLFFRAEVRGGVMEVPSHPLGREVAAAGLAEMAFSGRPA
ncbi:MAG: type I-C CRISPR-associated protein Cas5 [Armatimonadota bacterium]